MDAGPEAFPDLAADASPPISLAPERVRARLVARHASSAMAATGITGLLSIFALLAHQRHLVGPEGSGTPLVGSALAAMLGGVSLLILAAHDLSWAARVDRPGAIRPALRVAIAGLVLAAVPILAGSALLIARAASGANVRAPLAALAFPALFVGSASAFGLCWLAGARAIEACVRDPAAHPGPALWKARAEGTKGCAVLLVALGAVTALIALLSIL